MGFNRLAVHRSSIFLAVFLFFSGLFAAPAQATKPDNSDYTNKFLNRSEADRVWWYMGAFTALGHLVTQSNKEQGDCIWNWYFKEAKKKRTIIEEAIRKYPDHTPSGVILALLFRDCGKFKVQ